MFVQTDIENVITREKNIKILFVDDLRLCSNVKVSIYKKNNLFFIKWGQMYRKALS